MIRHVVFFAFKESAAGNPGEKNAKLLAEKYRAISAEDSSVLSCECGMNYNTAEQNFYPLCLNQTFDRREDLDRYLAAPPHQEVRKFVMEVIDHRMVVDYEI